MSKNCPSCHTVCDDDSAFCKHCGFALSAQTPPPSDGAQNDTEPAEQALTPAEVPMTPVTQVPVTAAQNDTDPAEQTLTPPEVSASPVTQAPVTDEPAEKKPKREKKPKKKGKLRGFLKFLLTLICIAAVLFILWITVGKWLTLRYHSDQVTEALNAGSLDFPGSHRTDYDDLPDYAKDMLGEDLKNQHENGPLMDAVLKCLKVERTAVHWFGFDARIDYVISAPNVEQWLLNLSKEDIAKGQEALISELEAYLPTAERCKKTVTVEYFRPHLFSVDWSGNYETPEFADAVSGGISTAYTALYEQAMRELEEMLK